MGGSLEKSDEFEIVGIVRDTKYDSVRTPGPPTMYRALGQSPNIPRINFVVRTAGEPLAMSEPVRTALREIDATLPIQRFTSQTEQISQRFAQERLFATAYTFFGALALLLACIGLFGLMSYTVSRRVNEIGIRMALGAQRSSVVRMILGEALVLVSVGVAIGIGGAFWAKKFVASVLFDVSPTDVPTMLGAIGLIVFIGALAGFLPARRASRVDPLIALQQQ
jgi:ABC-type antimicrobial peptide transport system permease subunit